ncbi:biotin--[acetyl-CoA-carboxylase] ligase [Bordetella genomosp. 1]|uniref:biotin--[biotin carboxyl-carrier protein] ligase n=1 Tax=Bordetella genomosp. 1 TaxID=1395607 RepID=A0A261RU60_9BORD|nr:biotin--[acetyl-CoA-carboxylase] ligase [Bordetella genomosp. 1]OZI28130.1 biotin--[acetyl-CoA-carboxylase] ligase [Bordetella genomosp. 1]
MSVPARPLALPAPDELARAIAARLPGFQDVAWVVQTGSTNADLMERARAGGAARPWLLGAHAQQSGRGRAGRSWANTAGATLMVSCAYEIRVPPARLPAISPLSGLAACEALRTLSSASGLCVKWPNDLQWHDAKLAGILVESIRTPGRDTHTVVIGMGLNLRDAAGLSAALGREVADWSQVTAHDAGPAAGVAELVAALALSWQDAVAALEQGGFEAFQARYAALDALIGRPVTVQDQGRVLHEGIACGLDEFGRLQVRTEQGTITVSVGEISVRARA